MPPVAHPGRLLKRELAARELSADRLALDIGVPSGTARAAGLRLLPLPSRFSFDRFGVNTER